MSYFKFQYKNPEELEPKKVDLTPGDASFKVTAVWDTKKDGTPLTTMNGTPKLTLVLSVIDCAGNMGNVYDDLTELTAWKIKTLLDAIGMPHLYNESGQFSPEDIIGCTGKCVIELKKSEGYADRTQVKRYLKPKEQAATVDYSGELGSDAIPF